MLAMTKETRSVGEGFEPSGSRKRRARNSFGYRVADAGNNSLDSPRNRVVGQILTAVGGFLWGAFVAFTVLRWLEVV